MSDEGAVVVVGGTRAIGLEIVKHYARAGREVVLSGRSDTVADAVAEAGGNVRGLTFDLAFPHTVAPALADVGPVDKVALVAIDRDQNTVADDDIDKAIHLVTLKLVGYTAVVSALRTRMSASSSIVLFGGMAKERPYPGSTTVTTVNGGVVGLTRTLVEELRPIRVNSIHPGVVGNSPYWAEKPAAIERYTSETPTGRLARMDEIVDATVFLLENTAVNGVDLIVDGGWHCR
jgi:NAD(P)-dependent dehydrogenase (short-subunit alcohol dehydrogenase family)